MKFVRCTTIFAALMILATLTGCWRTTSPGKVKIESVKFHGNRSFSSKRLYRVMVSRPSSLLRSRYYNERIFEDDLQKIVQFYHQQGYLQASTGDFTVDIDKREQKASITIDISEGERTYIEGISVFGNSNFSDTVFLDKTGLRINDPFVRSRINRANTALLELYANNGFLYAEVVPDIRINAETRRALVDYRVNAGIQYTVGGITITGLEKTRRDVVERELEFHTGEVIKYNLLVKSQRKVYMTGLFQSAFIRPIPAQDADSTRKDILVELKENDSGEFNVSVGYGSYERLRGSMEIINNNVRGRAQKVSLGGKLSFVDRSLRLSLSDPRTFNTAWKTDVNIMAELREEPGYDLTRYGGNVAVGRSFLNRSTVTLTYRSELATLRNVRVSKVPENEGTKIHSLKVTLRRDTRDNLFNTTVGYFIELSNEVGRFSPDRKSDIDVSSYFMRSTGTVRYFRPLRQGIVAATALELGWMDARLGLDSVPLQERFYAGGHNSVRGFDYRKVGPLNERRIPTGGKLRLIWHVLEIRRRIYRMLGGVLFADMGAVWEKPSDIDLRDLRAGIGCGLRLNSPIGLGRLDYGINLDRRTGESFGNLYFSMGQAF